VPPWENQVAQSDSDFLDKNDIPEKTSRTVEREREEIRYTNVIVKRIDESTRHPDDILERTIEEGQEQLYRPFISLLLSSFAAALILSFTVMAVALVVSGLADADMPFVSRVAVAFVYPLGFILCIFSGTQLFTEHTATAIYPVLDKRASPKRLLRLWATVILGNLLGAFSGALLLTSSDVVIGASAGYEAIGHHLVSYPFKDLLLSAVLAGWLMAIGAWLLRASADATSHIIAIFIVTFLIGLGGLHHSIAGAVEMFAALLVAPHFTIQQAAFFIATAVAGNLIGGSIFVGVLNYAQIRSTQIPAADSKI
tara:strand:+ start:45346 stop:46278 length:933 start_codon:yes stop_codon:yes gene_type:complete